MFITICCKLLHFVDFAQFDKKKIKKKLFERTLTLHPNTQKKEVKKMINLLDLLWNESSCWVNIIQRCFF